VAPPAPELPEVSPQTALPLAMVAMVSAAPATGVDPTSSLPSRLLLAALAALTVIAALGRQYATVRLGAALTATLAAFALPWQVAWWPRPGLVGIGAYLAGGALPARRGPQQAGRRPEPGRRVRSAGTADAVAAGAAPAPTDPARRGGAHTHGRSTIP
jgi:hypothetical protein